MTTEQFVDLVNKKHVQVRLNLQKLSSIYELGNIELYEFNGESKDVWCDIKPINNFSSLSYKVLCVPTEKNYNNKDFYTMDLLRLIEKSVIKLRVVYDKKYNDMIGEKCYEYQERE